MKIKFLYVFVFSIASVGFLNDMKANSNVLAGALWLYR